MLKRKKFSLYTSIWLVIIGYAFMYDHLFWRLQLTVAEGSALRYPGWLCYALILLAIPGLAEYQKSVTLLRPLAWYLGAVTFVRWIFQLVGRVPDGWYVYAVNVITSVVVLYFHFQLQTNLCKIIKPFNSERSRLIRNFRSVSAVVNTFLCLPLNYAPESEAVRLAAIFIGLFATLGVGGTQSELLMSLRDIREKCAAGFKPSDGEEENA